MEPSQRFALPVELSNPGQFFACCGVLEIADRLWPGAEGWFEERHFVVIGPRECTLQRLLKSLLECDVANTMTPAQCERLAELSAIKKKQREAIPGAEEEKKALESLRRELPIVFSGTLAFCVDWFCNEFSGGSRFKTWAGQQSVLEITKAMHDGLAMVDPSCDSVLTESVRGVGLPFNFDSDLGGQGSALDVGFSFDPLASSEATRIEGTCKPALELFAFIGLQRFRPREFRQQNRFVYSPWSIPLAPSVAPLVASTAVNAGRNSRYEFKLLYRTKYLKSFLPAIPYQGDRDE